MIKKILENLKRLVTPTMKKTAMVRINGEEHMVLFEDPKDGEWVRLFKKPDNTVVSQKTMKAPQDWEFLFSVKLPVKSIPWRP